MILLKKGSRKRLSNNLVTNELDCKCTNISCTRTLVHPAVISMFEILREKLDTPLTITSGFRCSLHNLNVGGKAVSRHTAGMAIDIICPELINFDDFYSICNSVFPFVLAYKNSNFCHCDVDSRTA